MRRALEKELALAVPFPGGAGRMSKRGRMVEPGQMIGDRFQIVGLIGQGGMGEVHEARELATKRRVAVKFMRSDLPDQEAMKDRFDREAFTLAGLQHPNIVTLFTTGIDSGMVFMVMEYLEGQTLAAVTQFYGRIKPRDVTYYGAVCSDALSEAHRNGILHRDVKPENIFILKHRRTLKLLDFGIAQLSASPTSADDDRCAIGTAHYMAPEQAQGHKVGPPADVYGLGATLYVSLTGGRHPFWNETTNWPDRATVLQNHVHAKPQPLFGHVVAVRKSLSDLILACLEKRPENRPTAEELATLLRKERRELPINADTTGLRTPEEEDMDPPADLAGSVPVAAKPKARIVHIVTEQMPVVPANAQTGASAPKAAELPRRTIKMVHFVASPPDATGPLPTSEAREAFAKQPTVPVPMVAPAAAAAPPPAPPPPAPPPPPPPVTPIVPPARVERVATPATPAPPRVEASPRASARPAAPRIVDVESLVVQPAPKPNAAISRTVPMTIPAAPPGRAASDRPPRATSSPALAPMVAVSPPKLVPPSVAPAQASQTCAVTRSAEQPPVVTDTNDVEIPVTSLGKSIGSVLAGLAVVLGLFLAVFFARPNWFRSTPHVPVTSAPIATTPPSSAPSAPPTETAAPELPSPASATATATTNGTVPKARAASRPAPAKNPDFVRPQDDPPPPATTTAPPVATTPPAAPTFKPPFEFPNESPR